MLITKKEYWNIHRASIQFLLEPTSFSVRQPCGWRAADWKRWGGANQALCRATDGFVKRSLLC